MDYWFISFKVRSRNGDTYVGQKIFETKQGISPHDALEAAIQDVAGLNQADFNAVRILAFNRV
ncbi:hypothetical protein [Moellerella wisconsensis]|uniref:Uncharacterized protein n=2 Tax=Moellerella wisconsensis TaxID=158849 RepID=A0ACD3Y6I3_9GAMM|nr:hypothetical protein [Moellerella wisconsensis]UNH26136.1 hypothetical protein MNY64_09535 [Moellerella wisconsensis]UNH29551.1 hypothetical protein MNY72_09095 [Moellerella wisconsensis]UNH37691.1 hypothetical protein MNY70_09120 [Moellerella wisconsensis]UNH41242.1 hypothetical protein MNY66_09135 [Moellerella wisconsensis]WJW80738.1 hypothetical protein QU516_08560 [Moellerella wisconsensis]